MTYENEVKKQYTFSEVHKFYAYAVSYLSMLGEAHGSNTWLEFNSDIFALYIECGQTEGTFNLLLSFDTDEALDSLYLVKAVVNKESDLKSTVKEMLKEAHEKFEARREQSEPQLELNLNVD